MTGRIKKARKQQELDDLAFNVLSSFRHQGAMQWCDWHETTRARRGKVGLGTTTFNNAVKRLIAEGRVRIDEDGCYRIVYENFNPADVVPAENERSSKALSGVSNGKGQDTADIALQQLIGQDS
jgi:hypothetical protein